MVLSDFHNIMTAKHWQVIMVKSLLYALATMDQQGQYRFAESWENLREVLRSVMHFCGVRSDTLAELWTSLTAFRCLAGDIEATRKPASERDITDALKGNPICGACPSADLGSLAQLRHCPYRVALCEDLGVALNFMAMFSFDYLTLPEFVQARLFLADAHAMLHMMIQMEVNKLDANLEDLD